MTTAELTAREIPLPAASFDLTAARRRVGAVGLAALPGLLVLFNAYGLYRRDGKRISHSTLDDVPWLFHALVVASLLLWLYYHLTIRGGIPFVDLLAFSCATIGCMFVFRKAARGLILILLEEIIGGQPSPWSFAADIVFELGAISSSSDGPLRTPERRLAIAKNRFGPSGGSIQGAQSRQGCERAGREDHGPVGIQGAGLCDPRPRSGRTRRPDPTGSRALGAGSCWR